MFTKIAQNFVAFSKKLNFYKNVYICQEIIFNIEVGRIFNIFGLILH